MTLKDFLIQKLTEFGVRADQYSIDDPKNYCMNFNQTAAGWQVWFQDAGEKYSLQSYSSLQPAVYDFVTRLTSTEAARQISLEAARKDFSSWAD